MTTATRRTGGRKQASISTWSFVDVLMQRYGDCGVDVTEQFDNCPIEVFVLGGLSPKKSGKNSNF